LGRQNHPALHPGDHRDPPSLTLAAAQCGREASLPPDKRTVSPPLELIAAWRSEQWGLPRGKGWKDEPAGSLERMMHVLNVYRAFKAFTERRGTENEFAEHYFDLWKIVIDVEKLEKKMKELEPRG